MSDNTLSQLDALNNWLGDIYGDDVDFSTLLKVANFSEESIEQLKQVHLTEFLQSIIDLLDNYNNLFGKYRETLVMQRYYGLADGNSQDFYFIGSTLGVCGERIRQLFHMGLVFYSDPDRQAKFHSDFVSFQ